DALDHENLRVAGQRILPGFEPRMADAGADEIHLSGAALVLLEGRNLLRIGRPEEDRVAAVNPAGVVGRVAILFHAVFRQLRLLACRRVAHPEVVVADERGAFAVRRYDHRLALAAFLRFAARPGDVARPLAAARIERNRLAIGAEVEAVERQAIGRVIAARRRRQRGGDLRLVEGGRLHAGGRIDEEELGAVFRRRAIPE